MLNKLLNAKFRSRYSFNFLAVLGLLFLLYLIYLFIGIIYLAHSEGLQGLGFPLILLMLDVFFISCKVCLIPIIIFCIEFFLRKRISNEKFLKSKVILFLQILGVLSIISPGIIIVLFLLWVLLP